MKNDSKRDYPTYPRQFMAYRWFKPLLCGLLFCGFFFLFASLVYLITSLAFHVTVSNVDMTICAKYLTCFAITDSSFCPLFDGCRLDEES